MASFIVSSGQSSTRMEVQQIMFTQDNAAMVYYLHYDAMVVRIVVARNGLKRILVDNRSSVNIIYRPIFNKMEVDHKLTSVTSPCTVS